MSVYERVMGVGRWTLKLRADTPTKVLEKVAVEDFGFGHLVLTQTYLNPDDLDDATMLSKSRYTGVFRTQADRYSMAGCGLAMWLGDEDGKGDIFESVLSLTTSDLVTWVDAVRPASLLAGSVTNPGGLLTKSFQYVTPREVLDDICGLLGVEWRVNPDFTLDAADKAFLYSTSPSSVIVGKAGESGRDPLVRGVQGKVSTARDVEDYTTKAVYAVSGTNYTASVTPAYTDPQGNPVVFKRVVEGSDATNGGGMAAAELAKYPAVRRAITLSAKTYNIGDDVALGDPVWVFDPLNGLTDITQEVDFRGQIIHPMVTRVLGYTWPVRQGYGVYFRHKTGSTVTWTDLTPFVEWEDADTSVEVGANPRSLF